MTEKNLIGNEFPDYFIMCSDVLVQKYNPTKAVVFGKIWNLSKKLGYCFMAVPTIAKQLGLSTNTISDSIKFLIDEKLIVDVTPPKFQSKKQVRWYAPCVLYFTEMVQQWYVDHPAKEESLSSEDESYILQKLSEINDPQKLKEIHQNLKNNLQKLNTLDQNLSDSLQKLKETDQNLTDDPQNLSDEPQKLGTKRLSKETKEDTKQNTTEPTTEETKKETREVTTPQAGERIDSPDSNSQEKSKTAKELKDEIREIVKSIPSDMVESAQKYLKNNGIKNMVYAEMNSVEVLEKFLRLVKEWSMENLF